MRKKGPTPFSQKGIKMQEILEVLQDTAIDTIKLLPFLFITYLIMEYIEHKTSNKVKDVIKKSGKFGPLLGAIVGVFPQCGFSVSATNLYAGRVITLGTLISVYLATSDEMLPILLTEAVPAGTIFTILGIKLVLGIVAGFIIDFVIRIFRKEKVESNEQNKTEKIQSGQKWTEEDRNEMIITMKSTQDKILYLMKENPSITQIMMANELGFARSTISSNIQKMKEQKIIERIGSDRNGYWKILKKE